MLLTAIRVPKHHNNAINAVYRCSNKYLGRVTDLNYINVKPEQVKNVVEQMLKQTDHVASLCKFTAVQTSAPTKKRKTHKFTISIEIHEDSIPQKSAIMDFGGFVILGLPEVILAEEFKGGNER